MNIPWINLGALILASILMPLTYILSLLPKTMERYLGKKAWKLGLIMRTASNLLEGVMIICLLLWIWHPVPELNHKIFENQTIGLFLALGIGIPFLALDLVAIYQLGMETHAPLQSTPLTVRGIYRWIRHPQMIFEISLFPLAALGMNSLPLFVGFAVYLPLYIILIKPFEEADMTKKYGAAYVAYKNSTGAIFPRILP